MNEMTDFLKGWWNCFISFAETNEFYADANDIPCLEVLEGAGVSVEEVDMVLHSTDFQLPDNVVRYLIYYKNKKQNDRGK